MYSSPFKLDIPFPARFRFWNRYSEMMAAHQCPVAFSLDVKCSSELNGCIAALWQR